jgi:hypothetical protein
MKLNQKGFAHWIVPILVIVAVGAIGTYLLTASHADSAQASVVVTNVGSGAQAPITIYLKDTTDSVGNSKSTGDDVNYLDISNPTKYKVEVSILGRPNAAYYGRDLYVYSRAADTYAPATNLVQDKAYTVIQPAAKTGFTRTVNALSAANPNLCDKLGNQGFDIQGADGFYKVKVCSYNNTTTNIHRVF